MIDLSCLDTSQAHLERMAGGKATLYLKGFDLSYLPAKGFAAANMEVRAFRVACTNTTVRKQQHAYFPGCCTFVLGD